MLSNLRPDFPHIDNPFPLNIPCFCTPGMLLALIQSIFGINSNKVLTNHEIEVLKIIKNLTNIQ